MMDKSLTSLKGIGPKSAEKFSKAGIYNTEDLLSFYPRTYDTLSEPVGTISAEEEGTVRAVRGFLTRQAGVRRAGSVTVTTGIIQSEQSAVPVIWFNMPWLRSGVVPGKWYIFRGYVKRRGKNLTLVQPRLYEPEDYEKKRSFLQPVYPLSGGLTETMLRKAIRQAAENLRPEDDYLPEEIRSRYDLISYGQAVRDIHFPESREDCIRAHRRLSFDELLLFILALRSVKETDEEKKVKIRLKDSEIPDRIISALPYPLTDAQRRAWQQVRSDMTGEKPMKRLIQGDVGSGKTIIAFLALALCAANGAQGALMVPTQVLARQHFEAFSRLCADHHLDYAPVLLTGSMTEAEKKAALEQIRCGQAKVIIGTHSLFQGKAVFDRLSLVITDEQHRFGVRQREALASKGTLPHTLVMSATPIPRTLAVTLYADLDLSVIDQMPAGRNPIKNCVIPPQKRPAAYRFIYKEISAGRQAYVICPMVEDSPALDAENVTDYSQTLRKWFGSQICVEALHGKMKPQQKNEIMERFAGGQIQVLVSTTVVEVGVNVPNASVMMIEDAQRFGLATLHQLRGRVGRGSSQGYCILVDGTGNGECSERLKIMSQTDDGFEIARKDLEMRGPGDLFGIRQSGLLDLKIADVFADAEILQQASEAADRLLAQDSHLESPQNRALREKLTEYMCHSLKNVNI